MRDAEIFSDVGITLLGGGEIGPDDIKTALHLAPLLVAADGGAAAALEQCHELHAVIGDLDSLSASDRARIPAERIIRIEEQDSTDFEKALRMVAAPVILGVGFLGARLDHQFAALNVLARHRHKPCILIGATEIVMHVPPILEMDLKKGDVVSLLPMAAVRGRSRGLEWPIDGLSLAPDGRIGTSNCAMGRIQLEMDGPGMLTIVPRTALPAAITALAATLPVAPASQ